MQSGRLDRRLKLLEPVRIKDAATGKSEAGYAVVTTVWARRVPASFAERIDGLTVVATGGIVYSIRYRADVDATWKAIEGNQEYKIVGTVQGNMRRRELFVHCLTEKPTRTDRG